MKHADKPDSVHRLPGRDRHYSGPGVATTARCYLPASSAEPHQRSPGLVLLRVEIARFTRSGAARFGWLWSCRLAPQPSGLRQPAPTCWRTTPIEHPGGLHARLVSVALILTSRWAAVSCYAVLCSPDVPPVPGFPDCTSGGLACFTGPIIADRKPSFTPCPSRQHHDHACPHPFRHRRPRLGPAPHVAATGRRAERLLAQLPLQASDHGADFGAGTGLPSVPIAPMAQVTALDMSAAMLQVLDERALPTSPRCNRTSFAGLPGRATTRS